MPRPDRHPDADDVIRVNDQFYILANSSMADDRTRVLKQGDTFAVFDRHGDIRPVGQGVQGVYHEGTRFLSRLELRLGKDRPMLLSSTVRDDNALLAVDLTNPDAYVDGEIAIQRGTLHIARTTFLWEGRCYERLRLLNYGQVPVDLAFSLKFEADFADIFEVRGMKRPKRGRRLPDAIDGGTVVHDYEGLDRVTRRTVLECMPTPTRIDAAEAFFETELQTKAEIVVFLTVSCEISSASARQVTYQHAVSEVSKGAPRVQEPSVPYLYVQRAVQRLAEPFGGGSPHDAHRNAARPLSLRRRAVVQHAVRPRWHHHGAGVPVDESGHGPRRVVATSPRRRRPRSIPSRMPSPARSCMKREAARWRRSAKFPSAATTAAWIRRRSSSCWPAPITSAPETSRSSQSIWPNIELALRVDGARMATSIMTDSSNTHATRRRAWFIKAGRIPRIRCFTPTACWPKRPIALCEVQGYVYAAPAAGGPIGARARATPSAAELWRQARSAATAVRIRLLVRRPVDLCPGAGWQEAPVPRADVQRGTLFVHRHCESANGRGWSRKRCCGRTSFSGGACGPSPSNEARYNPMSYHNGSVWPHDNALIAGGWLDMG